VSLLPELRRQCRAAIVWIITSALEFRGLEFRAAQSVAARSVAARSAIAGRRPPPPWWQTPRSPHGLASRAMFTTSAVAWTADQADAHPADPRDSSHGCQTVRLVVSGRMRGISRRL